MSDNSLPLSRPCTGGCYNVLCSLHGCQHEWDRSLPHPYNNWVAAPVTAGCICPPTSEQTCLNDRCPRKPWKPYTMTTTTAQKQEDGDGK